MFGPGLQTIVDRVRLRLQRTAKVHQAGAIPYTIVDGRVVFLIVTSRRTGRWIFPKGSLANGLTPAQSAEREAAEEAGVEGIIDAIPIGNYRTIKKRTLTKAVVDVELYPLRVTRQYDEWPEQFSRYRHWVLLPEARRLLSDPKLIELATTLARKLQAASPAERQATAQDATSPSSR